MNEQELEACYELAIKLTKKCGEFVREGFENASKKIENKGRHWDFVTEYDTKVENYLMSGILEKYPNHKFLAEETSFKSDKKPVLTDDPTWIIDPIDGTNNFIRGIKFTAISVALAVRKDLKIGIIYAPCTGEFYAALKGKGTFFNGKRVFTSKIEELKQAMVGSEVSIASYEPCREAIMARTKAFITECMGIRAFGSAALSLAYVANGQLDSYCIEYLKPWDIAAGVVLIREAGGAVININGGEYDILKPDIIAASSEKLAKRILSIVQNQ